MIQIAILLLDQTFDSGKVTQTILSLVSLFSHGRKKKKGGEKTEKKKGISCVIGLLLRLNETRYPTFLNIFLGHTKCSIIRLYFSFLPQSPLFPLSFWSLSGARELSCCRQSRVQMSKIPFEALACSTLPLTVGGVTSFFGRKVSSML